MAGNWPNVLRRLDELDWSMAPPALTLRYRYSTPTVTVSKRQQARGAASQGQGQAHRRKSKIKFVKIQDKGHPAFGQLGAFATGCVPCRPAHAAWPRRCSGLQNCAPARGAAGHAACGRLRRRAPPPARAPSAQRNVIEPESEPTAT